RRPLRDPIVAAGESRPAREAKAAKAAARQIQSNEFEEHQPPRALAPLQVDTMVIGVNQSFDGFRRGTIAARLIEQLERIAVLSEVDRRRLGLCVYNGHKVFARDRRQREQRAGGLTKLPEQ